MLCLAFSTALIGTAFAIPSLDPTATVTSASAPNAYGSPSFTAWVDNAIQGQYLGVSSYGTPGTPSYYQAAPAAMSVYDNIVTGFPSWNGQADPGTAFGAGFANELGNRLHFTLDLVAAPGTWVSPDKISFLAFSTDPGNSLGFSFGIGSYGYSSNLRGLMYGFDGLRGTADDYWIIGGPSWQQVNEIFFRGSGNAWAAYTSDPGATLQDKIDNVVLSLPSTPFEFTGTYSYNGAQVGQATVTFNGPASSVPDSGSTAALLAMSLIGVVGLSGAGGIRWRMATA